MRTAVIKKKPNEKFAVGFRYSTADLAKDSTISTVEVTITPSGNASDLTVVGSPAKDDYVVSAMLQKGVDGVEYFVSFKTTTSAGQVFQDTIFVKVRS